MPDAGPLRIGVGRCLAALAALVLSVAPAAAQSPPGGPPATPLAVGELPSVVELPAYFRLYRVHLPAAQHASYRGSSAMLYDLSGGPEIVLEAAAAQPLAVGAGAFVPAGQGVKISAAASEPAELLLFVLTARPNQKPPFDRPAVVKELCRTGDPLPGLKAGKYQFTLSRVTYPAGLPPAPPYYQTGAAVDYVAAGDGSLIADGKTEPMPRGTAQPALSGWFHQWINPGGEPLVIVRAQIAQQGAPAVVPEPAK